MHVSKCVFCFIYYNCTIILLSVTVFVCHDKGNVFYNKFTSICILETSKNKGICNILFVLEISNYITHFKNLAKSTNIPTFNYLYIIRNVTYNLRKTMNQIKWIINWISTWGLWFHSDC